MKLRWATEQRVAWIADVLRTSGSIRRVDLRSKFGISAATASGDLRRFWELYPGAMRYDRRKKRYVAKPAKLPAAPVTDTERVELDAAHAKLNALGVPNVIAGPNARTMTLAERLAHVVSLEHHTKSLAMESPRSAVEAEVVERCAQVCDDYRDKMRECAEDPAFGWTFGLRADAANELQSKIRAIARANAVEAPRG